MSTLAEAMLVGISRLQSSARSTVCQEALPHSTTLREDRSSLKDSSCHYWLSDELQTSGYETAFPLFCCLTLDLRELRFCAFVKPADTGAASAALGFSFLGPELRLSCGLAKVAKRCILDSAFRSSAGTSTWGSTVRPGFRDL